MFFEPSSNIPTAIVAAPIPLDGGASAPGVESALCFLRRALWIFQICRDNEKDSREW